ncbi:hypothetical protein BTUL_0274g00140 [Botrytis tulipae]|uniref:Uncharacterized protein n=1 Tax=Botrytis tulipae TaxID=87230 RepID=A0A4Z1E9L3_9HELO|nr:hypothetical protein BTUL_0274g00140 [Botrytis tulipae]
MDSSNFYQRSRSNLKIGLEKRIRLLREKVRDSDLHTKPTRALQKLYAFRIAETYVNEATQKFASEGLTRKDIDNIHGNILKIPHIPLQFLNDIYKIVHTPDANICGVISYFLRGKLIIPALLNKIVESGAQANIAWQIVCLNTLSGDVERRLSGEWEEINSTQRIGIIVQCTNGETGIGDKIQITIYISSPRRILELNTHLESSSPRVFVNNFEMKANPIISASKTSAEASEVTKSEIKRMERRAGKLEEEGKRLELEISLRQKEVAALRKEKANGWIKENPN